MGKQTWRRRASFMDARRMIFECKCIVLGALRLRLAIKPALCQMTSKLQKRCPKIHNIGKFWGPPRASLGCRSQRLFWTLPKSSQQTLPERADRPPVQAASRSSEAEPTRARPRAARPASNLTERLPSNAENPKSGSESDQKSVRNPYTGSVRPRWRPCERARILWLCVRNPYKNLGQNPYQKLGRILNPKIRPTQKKNPAREFSCTESVQNCVRNPYTILYGFRTKT